jgi:hypothetical protein
MRLREIEYRFDQMVPHSFIAKQLIGKSLHLGKTLTKPFFRIQKKPKKAYLNEEEFNQLLEQLIAERGGTTRQLAFALLRLRELISSIQHYQEGLHFQFHQSLFL